MIERPEEIIRSTANQSIKRVRLLQRRKGRDAEQAFVVEGARAIADALATGAVPSILLVRHGEQGGAADPPMVDGLHSRQVEATLFDDLSDTVTPQGMLAVFPFPDVLPPDASTPLVVVIDGVRDPGNLGTLLRSAAGAGATAVYMARGSVDAFHPKVVRAAMGAHFRIAIRTLTPAARAELSERCPVRVVADARAAVAFDAIDWTGATALIVGSETAGALTEASLATVAAAIPLASEVESLNAGVAGAILLFEAARQRRRATVTPGADGRLGTEGAQDRG